MGVWAVSYIYAAAIGMCMATVAVCAFLGFGPNAGPQPAAPQHDQVPVEQGDGVPLFRMADGGAG